MLKRIVRRSLQLLSSGLILPLYAVYFLINPISRKDRAFTAFAQFLSLLPGITGSYLRVAFYNLVMKKCDRELYIGFATQFSQQQTELHQGVYIGPQCNIGQCRIEANCLLGSGVHIISGKEQHKFSDLNTPIRHQGGIFTDVTIGEDSWIGNGALIMANIGKKCIIGAGSVVINDIPDFSIAAGNPAKIIKTRLS